MHRSSFVLVEELSEFRMLQAAKIHEGCNINSSSANCRRTNSDFGFFYFLEVPSPQMFELVHSLSTAALASGIFHRLVDSDGVVNQAVVEFRHVLFFLMWSMCF